MALINKLEAIGDAIREKTGKEDLLTLDQMPIEIRSIETGGGGEGGYEPPAEAFILTGNCQYKFANNGWNWFINDFGDKITTNNITNASYMFNYSTTLPEIPFEINLGKCTDFSNMFNGCNKLRELPVIRGTLPAPTGDYAGTLDLTALFWYCTYVREIPNDFFITLAGEEYWTTVKNYRGNRNNIFSNCYSLRKLPDISMLVTKETSTYNTLYSMGGLYTLDELINIPVYDTSTFTSNAFKSFGGNCYRAKNITFAVNEDGTPKVVNWKNQTINLNNNVGYSTGYSETYITNYNSGITADKAVYDDASYQALKDDPDWYVKPSATNQYRYSRYNHDSAVNTINSLPDTSAYLASAGGTNTIKFLGAAGEATDGGAINTLTEEEIAVATAKGWTVTLV